MKQLRRRVISLLLVAAMTIGHMGSFVPMLVANAQVVDQFQGGGSDAFSVLGFDTTKLPEGYNEDYTKNPYGTDRLTGNQFWELADLSIGTSTVWGYNNNEHDPMTQGGQAASFGPIGMNVFQGVAGDFDGDGLEGEVAYVGMPGANPGNFSEYRAFSLSLVDAKTGARSANKEITRTAPVNSGHANSDQIDPNHRGVAFSSFPWLNLMQVEAGDFDGDGRDEIAVYIPDPTAPRIEFYRMKVGVGDGNWLNLGNWESFWTHNLEKPHNLVPNMVSMAAGDINRDGIDDLALSTGLVTNNPGNVADYYTVSQAFILWGSATVALEKSDELPLMGGDIKVAPARVGLTFDDVDGDGVGDLIMAGSPYNDITTNTSRVMATYVFDGEKIVMASSLTYKVIDGEYVTRPDGQGGESAPQWEGANGLDPLYYSMPFMVANVAALKPEPNSEAGIDGVMLYVDSVLYRYTEGDISMAYALDEAGGIFGSSWPRFNYGVASGPVALYNIAYVESGAVTGHIGLDGYETLKTALHGVSTQGAGQSVVNVTSHLVTIEGNSKGDANNPFVMNAGAAISNSLQSAPPQPLKLDMDKDTLIIEYTGNSYMTYSNPKVLAIIAAAPYFEDVDRVTGYDYAWQNTTSWSRINGSANGDLFAFDLEVGAFIEGQYANFGIAFGFDTSINFTYEYEELITKEESYTLTFTTSQDEDAVAFFSIPTQNYLYKVTDVATGEVRDEIISIPFQPNYQVLNLDYYESIQGDYAELPPVRGVAINSTPGDPASYPSSAAGLNVTAQWNDDPSGLDFGNGSQDQTITITDSVEESYNYGAAIDFSLGGGKAGQSDKGQALSIGIVGAQFSINPSSGYVQMNLTGTEITGSVTNMPEEFRDYGYYYNWKIFSYAHEFEDGSTIPVVSYIVNDVQQPPELPDDFQQDYDMSTHEKNVLTWTYPHSASATFHVYRNYNFQVGGGIQKIATIKSTDGDHFTYVKGEDGRLIKQFFFEDPGISPYSVYEYSIQVEEPYPYIPPLSSPSELVTVISRAENGYPILSILESDNNNDGNLLVYPDRNASLTAEVTGPDGQAADDFYATIQYQWQKMEGGQWTDLVNRTEGALWFKEAGSEVAGQYRCRVNVITRADNVAMTSYTKPVGVTQAKRTTIMEDLKITDLGNDRLRLQTTVKNAHSDSQSVPEGHVLFTFENKESGESFIHTTPLNVLGKVDKELEVIIPDGLYHVRAYYEGSYIFKPVLGETMYITQGGVRDYNIDAPSSIEYGDGATIEHQLIEKKLGVTIITPDFPDDVSVTRDDVAVAYTEILTQTAKAGQYTIKPNAPAGQYEITMTTGVDEAKTIVTIKPREITLKLPEVRLGVNTAAANFIPIKLADLEVIAGSWAPHETSGSYGTLDLKGNTTTLIFYNTANAAFKGYAEALVTSGNYRMTHGILETDGHTENSEHKNYRVTFLDGALSALGASYGLTAGANLYEGDDVGVLHMLSPDVKLTRNVRGIEGSYPAGSVVTFFAQPDEGYEVYNWFVDGISKDSKDQYFALTMPSKATTVDVQFTIKQNVLTYGTVGDEGGGTIAVTPDTDSGTIVQNNSELTFTATANPGYHFVEWRYTKEGAGTIYDNTDEGKMSSTYNFTMPGAPAGVLAVFERDFYTLTLEDRSGQNGLTAWYIGSTGSDSTAGGEKIYLASGALIKGDTEVIVEAAPGYFIDSATKFTVVGSEEGRTENGRYTFRITGDTTASGATKRGTYNFSLATVVDAQNYVGTTAASPSAPNIEVNVSYPSQAIDDTVTPTVGTQTHPYNSIPGGEDIVLSTNYPSYYTFLGWEVTDIASTTPIERPSIIESGDPVTVNSAYRYMVNSTEYYFIAAASGIATMEGENVTINVLTDTFVFDAIREDSVVTANFEELPYHIVTLSSIDDAEGAYENITLPEGARSFDGADPIHAEIFLHEGDDLNITVTAKSGYTNTYWEVINEAEVKTTIRATSRTLAIKSIGENYTVTPDFTSNRYHNITWPNISENSVGVRLNEYGSSVTPVRDGGTFSFTLLGQGSSAVESVYANGQAFPAVGGTVDGIKATLSASEVGGTTVYTMTGIEGAQVLTVDIATIGITVDGVDISKFSGNGWKYNNVTGKLTISENDLVISGAWTVEDGEKLGTDLSIEVAPNVARMTLQDLTVEAMRRSDDEARSIFDLNGRGYELLTLTLRGDNLFDYDVSYIENGGLLNTKLPDNAVFNKKEGDLLILGNGTMIVNNMSFHGQKNDAARAETVTNIHLREEVDITVNFQILPAAEGDLDHNNNEVMIVANTLTMGIDDTAGHDPSLTLNQSRAFDLWGETDAVKVQDNKHDYGTSGVVVDIASELRLHGGDFTAVIETHLANWDHTESWMAFDMLKEDIGSFSRGILVDGGNLTLQHNGEHEIPRQDISRTEPTRKRLLSGELKYGGSGTIDISSGTAFSVDNLHVVGDKWSTPHVVPLYLEMTGDEHALISYNRQTNNIDPERYYTQVEFATGVEKVDATASTFDLNPADEDAFPSTSERYYKYLRISPTTGDVNVDGGLTLTVTGSEGTLLDDVTLPLSIEVVPDISGEQYSFEFDTHGNIIGIKARSYSENIGEMDEYAFARVVGNELTLLPYFDERSFEDKTYFAVDFILSDAIGERFDVVLEEVADNEAENIIGAGISSLTLDDIVLASLDIGTTLDAITISGDVRIEGGELATGGDLTILGAQGSTFDVESAVPTLDLPTDTSSDIYLVNVDLFTMRNAKDGGALLAAVPAEGVEHTVRYLHESDILGDYAGHLGHSYSYRAGATRSLATEQTSYVIDPHDGYLQVRPLASAAKTVISGDRFIDDNDGDANNTTNLAVDFLYYVSDMGIHNFASVAIDTTLLTENTNYTLTPSGEDTSLVLGGVNYGRQQYTLTLTEAALAGLADGSHTVRITFEDDMEGDSKTYTLDIPLQIIIAPVPTGELSVSGDKTIAFRGDDISLEAVPEGDTPARYEWTIAWQGGSGNLAAFDGTPTGDTAIVNIPADGGFGTAVVTVKSYATQAADAVLLGTATHTFTVYPKLESVTASIQNEIPNNDGSYSIVQHLTENATTWELIERLRIDGSISDFDVAPTVSWDVVYETSVDTDIAGTTLTIGTSELGSNGIILGGIVADNAIMVKVTYTHTPSGQEIEDSFIIRLSTDAQVSYDNEGALNGTITSATYNEGESTIPSAGALVPLGEVIKVTATPDSEYKVKTWYVNGTAVNGDPKYTIDEENHTLIFSVTAMGDYVITADYVNKNNYIITFESPENGTLTAASSAGSIESGTSLVKGSDVTFKLTLTSGYTIGHWLVNGNIHTVGGTTFVGGQLSFQNIDRSYAVSAVLVPQEATLNVTTDNNGTVNFFVNGVRKAATLANNVYSLPVVTGDTVVAYAVPNDGYQVASWTRDGAVLAGDGSQTIVVGATVPTYAVTFEAIPKHNVTVTVIGEGTVVSGDKEIDKDTIAQERVISVDEHGFVTLLAVPGDNMEFAGWEVSGDYTESGDGNAVTITDITSNITVEAEFIPLQYTVEYSSSGEGSLDATYEYGGNNTSIESGNAVRAGLPVTLTATANENHHLHAITLNGEAVDFTRTGASGTYVIATLNANVVVEAIFVSNATFAVTAPTTFADDPNNTDDGAGTASIDVEEDGVSADGNPASVVTGGAALITFTPVGDDVTVDPTKLVEELEAIITAEGSAAEVSLSIDGASYTARISGIDTALDFSGIENPFLGGQTLVAIGTQSDEGGVMLVRYEGATLSNLSQIPHGATVEITLVAQPGYELTGLSSENGEITYEAVQSRTRNAASSTTYIASLSVNEAQTITPVFTKSDHTVTINIVGTGLGSVMATGGGQTVELVERETGTISGTLPAGSNVTVTATAGNTAELASFIVGSTIVTGTSHQIANLNGDVVITAVFDALEKVVTVDATGNGELSVYNGTTEVSDGDALPVGTQLLLLAAPDPNNSLTSLTAGGAAAEPGSTYRVAAEHNNSIVAEFSQSEATVTWSDPVGGAISVTQNGNALTSGDLATIGQDIVITVKPSSSYTVTGITVNGNFQSGERRTYTVMGETVISATLTPKAVGDAPYLVVVSSGGTLAITDQTGATVQAGAELAAGTVLTFRATPNSGYTFSSISINGRAITNGGTYTVLASDRAITAVATFTPPAGTSVGGGNTTVVVGVGGEYSVKLRTEGGAVLTVLDESGDKVEDGTILEGGHVITISAISENLDRHVQILVNGHPFENGNDYELYANTEIFATDSPQVGLPYYMSEGVKMFIGFADDMNEDGYILKDEYLYYGDEGIFFTENPKTFTDITGHWGKTYIDFVTERELFLGTSAHEFSPDTEMTRAMFATVLGRMHERSYGEIVSSGTNAFSDCDYNLYYGKYVDWAAENDILLGIGGGLFAPNLPITREAMATILYRYATFTETLPQELDRALAYSDSASISSWASEAALFTQSTGIIQGMGENNFAPSRFGSRTEVATMLNRFIRYILDMK